MAMRKVGGLDKMETERRNAQKLQSEAKQQHDHDVAVAEVAYSKRPPALEGHLNVKDHGTAMAEATRDTDAAAPGTHTYMDAINKAFKEYQTYHEKLLKHSVDKTETHSALQEFDTEVEKIRKQGAARRKQRREQVQQWQSGQGAAPDEQVAEQEYEFIGDKPCGDFPEEKKPPPKIYPKVCHPENVWLEFAPKKDDYHAQGTAWSDTLNINASLTTGQRKLYPPGWLVDLTLPQIKAFYNIKAYLTDLRRTDDITKPVDDLYTLLQRCGVTEITKPEITRAFRFLPVGKETGLDYRAFLFILGDFGYASLRHATRPYPRKFICSDEQNDAELYKGSEFDNEVKALFDEDSNEFKSYFETAAIKAPKLVEEPPPFPIRNPEEYVPTRERQAMTDWRKRIIENREKQLQEQSKWAEEIHAERMRVINEYRDAYNKQLKEKKLHEAHDKEMKEKAAEKRMATKKRMTQKYISEGIPRLTAEKKAELYVRRLEHEEAEKDRHQDLNFYTARQKIMWTGLFLTEMYEALNSIKPLATSPTGFVPRKLGPKNEELYKAWREEQLENEANAPSPYLSPLPFVSVRLAKQNPQTCPKKCNSSGKTKVAFDHWIMDIPKEGEGRIVISENRFRIKQILDYVFFKSGSTLCLLPRVELMLHFAHNLVDQLLGRADKGGGCPEKGIGSRPPTAATSATISTASKTKNTDPDKGGTSRDSKTATNPGTENAGSQPQGAPGSDLERVPTPFRNPARDVPPTGCHPQPELPIRQICKGKTFPSPDLPAKFDGTEARWVQKYGESLYRAANPKHQRPTEDYIPYRRLRPLRNCIANFHAKEWDAYNCRRFRFRKSLWENMQVENYNSDTQRSRFANTFWALLPHDNRPPRALLNTNVERALHRL